MRFAAVALLLSLAALPASTQDAAGPSLKVRKIVVYKHGVGYFEREGTVTGNQRVTLGFKSAQMKDLLKSLYAVDLGGGKIATIQYDTRDPLSKQLEDILIRVPEGNALTQFLTQLKGARVEATIGGETATGSVVGIEPVQKTTPSGTTTSYKLVLFRDDGKIQPLDLLEVSGLKLLDEGLQKDLKRLLDLSLKSKYSDRKSVVLDAQGQGERPIRVGYIIETPIWKTSYRLLFEEGQKPLLQGWAILENTTDEDWEQVDVSFVAGSPMSFVMDLYTAYYPARHEIPVGVAAAARPEGLDRNAFGAAAPKPSAPAAARMRGAAEDAAKADEKAGGARRELRKSFAEELEGAALPAATGVEVGDLFAYQSREKVSVKRGQAALVPILSERVDGGERVLYWKPGVSERPMNSFYFKNSTPLTLEAGPVTFFDGSTCIGEGLMRRVLKKDMKDMLPYAIEAGVTVETKVDHRADPVVRARIVHGVLQLSRTQNVESVYTVKSRLGKDVVFYLDHAKAHEHALAEPAKAEDEVDGHYRFRIELKAGQTAELKVRETMPTTQSIALLQTPAETIRYWQGQRVLSEAAKKFLADLLALQGALGQLRQREQELAQERARIAEDDQRVRQNLGVLRETPSELEMRRKYLQKLSLSDARLDEIRAETAKLQAQRAESERELARKVAEFRDE